MNKVTVIVIGAGPAGIACAVQLKRYNIDLLVIEKESIGGLIKNANLIENYVGFPNGISGKKFTQLLEKQVETNNLSLIYENVKFIKYADNSFFVQTDNNNYISEYIVLASGTKPIIPHYYSDKLGELIFTDIYKLSKVKNKIIGIIGAGDCAFDYAINLSSHNNITILNRNNRIKATSVLQDRVFENEKIQYFDNTTVKAIRSDEHKLKVICNNRTLVVDYLFIAVGREPNLDFIGRQTLNNPNLFQIGDVKNGLYRQISIAISDGIYAAMKINRLLTQG